LVFHPWQHITIKVRKTISEFISYVAAQVLKRKLISVFLRAKVCGVLLDRMISQMNEVILQVVRAAVVL